MPATYPPPGTPLRVESFFERIDQQYDPRSVRQAPAFEAVTRRRVWDASLPALAGSRFPEYRARAAADT